ncbi:MAG: ABC transporter permease [Oscillospiraceae bacterium]|nr:ABC transporter permease [Oscillospiraceae bacterium]MBQ1730188.1 ABC transporter permease [Oscillospiraceae bacterium]MBQ2329295.1 ABC transporter permease [Oscillospiraceae bacterium]MBQ3951038.1 ABC transporter permease [Oscillospiraceae bacterium]MBQ5567907.1 ABC transporter permease [Oscillospiraceae bacterium]
MKRAWAFAERNVKEVLRDPLSYIFCIGFPLVMLVIMTLVNQSIPKESGMTIFRIDRLSGGVAIFGQTFVMLFAALCVAGDRSGSFLVRMYATPMKSRDFVFGYIIPLLLIAVIQCAFTMAASLIISLITGVELSIAGLLIAIVVSLPSAVMFIGFGLLFGTLFNEKAAPGLCSIIISLGSFLGGIWFDPEMTGGVLLKICRCLPFIYSVKSVRSAIALNFGYEEFWLPLIVVIGSAIVISALGALAFRRRMRADLS